ncbi:serine/threonine protein kinase [Parafrankia sp. EAN1pec]|nr:serine/threonine protein kinase [Frankia sp. EAN1pec]
MGSTPVGTPGEYELIDGPVLTRLRPGDPREISDYLLHARIGEGGMGAVYLSYTRGGRPVAVKVIRPEHAADPGFRRRFEKEVEIARKVQGRYTAEVVGFDAQAPRPWLATVYVGAPSLAASIARHGPLPTESVLVMAAGVAEALQSIHAAGVIHRDLTPGNIILAGDGPRVIDFGISRAVENPGQEVSQSFSGSPPFMAPEQISGQPLNAAGDIFSLGATAYFAVTGEKPFGVGPLMYHRIVHDEPDWDRCPEQIREILRQCLKKDPGERPTPAALIRLCQEASTSARLRVAEGWLPSTVVADLTRYVLAPPGPPRPTRDPETAAAQPASTRSRRRAAWLVGGLSTAAFVVVVVLLVTSGKVISDRFSGSTPALLPSATGRSTSEGPAEPAPAASAPPTTSSVPSVPTPSPSTTAPFKTAPAPPAPGPVAGGQLHIAGSGSVLYAIDGQTGVHMYSESGRKWISIGGPKGRLYGGGYGLFATDDVSGDIYRYLGAPGRWQRVGYEGRTFAVTGDALYGLTPDGKHVNRYTGSGEEWYTVGDDARTIYGGGYGLFATNPITGHIYRYLGSAGWTRIGGPGADFAVTGDALYGLTPDGKHVNRYTGSGEEWYTVGDDARTIYGGGYGLFATNPITGHIYRYLGSAGWTRIGGPGADFAVTEDRIYGLSEDGKSVSMYSGSGDVWFPIGVPSAGGRVSG